MNIRQLLSWYEMYELHANRFLKAFSEIDRLDLILKDFGGQDTLRVDASIRKTVADLHGQLQGMGLAVAATAAKRLCATTVAADVNLQDFHRAVREIRSRMVDELGSKFWLHLDNDEARYYSGCLDIFGKGVIDKLPMIYADLEEAGKCYGVGRYTACVFHLMRVMEYCLQQFGGKLGVVMPDQLVWQVILNQIQKAIKSLDPKLPAAKKYSEIAAHLYSVKVAWRNDVMHPKPLTLRKKQMIS